MSAFSAALAIAMHAHGAVTATDDAPGIPQTLDGVLINGITPDATFDEKVKTGGMGEEAFTIRSKYAYELAVDAEYTSLAGPWINRHPGEVFTYASLGLYTSVTAIRHGFPTGSGLSWQIKSNKQGLRAGDFRKCDLTLKLLFKPTLSAQLVTPAAAA